MDIISLLSGILAIILFFVARQYKDISSFIKNNAEKIFYAIHDRKLYEATYYKYRKRKKDFKYWEIVIEFFEKRYKTSAFIFNGVKLPVSVIWSNTKTLIDPDTVLGTLDSSSPLTFAKTKYRNFIKKIEERPDSPIKHESINYRFNKIIVDSGTPKINGALGKYYDNILTQYGMEWEINKIINNSNSKENFFKALTKSGALPLREKLESKNLDPLYDGSYRSASLTISTLCVYKRESGYYCLVKKRSDKVAVLPNMFHVIPAAMFEPAFKDYKYEWSIKFNIFREILEELYNIPEVITSSAANPEHLYSIEPMPFILKLLNEKKAELSITGLTVDLLALRTEINTIFFVNELGFCERKKIEVNWEYADELEDSFHGDFSIRIDKLDDFIKNNININNFVYGGAVTLELGRRWLKERHNIF